MLEEGGAMGVCGVEGVLAEVLLQEGLVLPEVGDVAELGGTVLF